MTDERRKQIEEESKAAGKRYEYQPVRDAAVWADGAYWADANPASPPPVSETDDEMAKTFAELEPDLCGDREMRRRSFLAGLAKGREVERAKVLNTLKEALFGYFGSETVAEAEARKILNPEGKKAGG